MTTGFTPELAINGKLAESIGGVCARLDAISFLEQEAVSGTLDGSLLPRLLWQPFQERVRELWRTHDHLVIRGLPPETAGPALLLVSLSLSNRFKTYRANKVVRHFRMSPWTTELSHTLKEGHFHTDINASPEPPCITGIQCKSPDPGAPKFGELRVARLSRMLQFLQQHGRSDLLTFIQEADVSMANDRSPDCWTGKIVENGRIRFHPETIRSARRRYPARFGEQTEAYLAELHELALTVSTPIQLGAADVLLVSNLRALHYRGACSVVFHQFPHVFTSREVLVLHTLDEHA